MRVMVTGGTGFVGSHTVAALVAAGHEVRLLVRAPSRIEPALSPFGLSDVDHEIGDITEPNSVRRAIEGCDAVLHAAAVYDLDSRAARVTTATNAPGARVVLDAAADAGCDPIVHVSSTVALLERGATVAPDAPLSTLGSPYIRSKVESERIARTLQKDGAPVTIVQPGAVLGPHDPHLSDQMRRLVDILKLRYPTWPTGGYHVVDVRDVAGVNAAVMTPGVGPRSYIVPGHHVSGATLFGTLRAVTGRRLPNVRLPATAALPVAWAASTLQRVLPFRIPVEHEGAVVCRQDTRCDGSRATEDLGIHPRPLEETLVDAVRWLHEAGYISGRQAGAAAA